MRHTKTLEHVDRRRLKVTNSSITSGRYEKQRQAAKARRTTQKAKITFLRRFNNTKRIRNAQILLIKKTTQFARA